MKNNGWKFDGEHHFPFGGDDQYFVITNETGNTPITVLIDATPVDNEDLEFVAGIVFDALKTIKVPSAK